MEVGASAFGAGGRIYSELAGAGRGGRAPVCVGGGLDWVTCIQSAWWADFGLRGELRGGSWWGGCVLFWMRWVGALCGASYDGWRGLPLILEVRRMLRGLSWLDGVGLSGFMPGVDGGAGYIWL